MQLVFLVDMDNEIIDLHLDFCIKIKKLLQYNPELAKSIILTLKAC